MTSTGRVMLLNHINYISFHDFSRWPDRPKFRRLYSCLYDLLLCKCTRKQWKWTKSRINTKYNKDASSLWLFSGFNSFPWMWFFCLIPLNQSAPQKRIFERFISMTFLMLTSNIFADRHICGWIMTSHAFQNLTCIRHADISPPVNSLVEAFFSVTQPRTFPEALLSSARHRVSALVSQKKPKLAPSVLTACLNTMSSNKEKTFHYAIISIY